LVCGEVKNAQERALVPDVFDLAAGQVDRSQGTRLRKLPLTRLSSLACGEVKNARERALVPDIFDLAAGQVDRSEWAEPEPRALRERLLRQFLGVERREILS
jgi:hypothetical protein